MVQLAPFAIDPVQTGIAIAYKNADFIAPLVLPYITVNLKGYKYTAYTQAEEFNVPDTFVGRRGNVPQIELTGTETTGNAVDYGLDIPVPQDDITQAAASGLKNPVDRATVKSTDYVDLGHEQRTANKVFTAANYPSGNKVTLSGTDQVSDPDSNALGLVMAALDVPLMRPNTLVFGAGSWTSFRTNPTIVKATNKNSGDAGAAARQAVAEVLEVKNIVVGQSRYNTAKPGQAQSLSRLWGKHLAMLFIDPLADAESGVTFGWTAQFGQTQGLTYFDPKIGVRGATVARSAKSMEERIVCSDCGYLFTNVSA